MVVGQQIKQAYSPKRWWKMVVGHGRIRKKKHQQKSKILEEGFCWIDSSTGPKGNSGASLGGSAGRTFGRVLATLDLHIHG